eukprot:4635737-Alexandrium_andersonii.AAC.1
MCIRDRCNAGRKPCAFDLGLQAPHLTGIALRTSRYRPAEAAVHGRGLTPFSCSVARRPCLVARRRHAAGRSWSCGSCATVASPYLPWVGAARVTTYCMCT